MRAFFAAVAALSLLSGLAAEVSAKAHRGRSQRHPLNLAPRPERTAHPAEIGGWRPHDTSKLPFGSAIWWDQMLRENRLTCCN
jgi:hypothetical protein